MKALIVLAVLAASPALGQSLSLKSTNTCSLIEMWESGAADSKLIVSVGCGGQVTIGPGFTADEASKQFFDKIAAMAPRLCAAKP